MEQGEDPHGGIQGGKVKPCLIVITGVFTQIFVDGSFISLTSLLVSAGGVKPIVGSFGVTIQNRHSVAAFAGRLKWLGPAHFVNARD